MNWASLFLAAAFGTPATVLLIHRKAPRLAALLAAVAALCVMAGIPSLLAALGHPLKPGVVLLCIVIAAAAAATFFYLDVLRGGHKTALMGRKGEGHHLRPFVATVGLAMLGLMVAMNWSAVAQGIGGGFGQTITTISHHGGA